MKTKLRDEDEFTSRKAKSQMLGTKDVLFEKKTYLYSIMSGQFH